MARYTFVNWTDETGAEASPSPQFTPIITSGKTFTANYVLVPVTPATLVIATSPVLGQIYVNGAIVGIGSASVTVDPGTHVISFGSVSGYITPSTQSVSVAEGQTVNVSGLYVQSPIPPVTYSLTIVPAAGGSTSPVGGVYTYEEGALVSVGAIASAGYVFDRWLLDGVSYMVNPIPVTMNADHTLTPVFTQQAPPPVQHTLTILAASEGGTTSPASGAYAYDEGSIVPVTALPYQGYRLDHWVLNAVAAGSTNPIPVTMDADKTLQPVFASEQPTPPPPPLLPALRERLYPVIPGIFDKWDTIRQRRRV